MKGTSAIFLTVGAPIMSPKRRIGKSRNEWGVKTVSPCRERRGEKFNLLDPSDRPRPMPFRDGEK